MAEGWVRFLVENEVEAFSAGLRASFVQPRAVQVMKERGIDISAQVSKVVDKLPVLEMDYIVTLCAEGADACPLVPGPAVRLHWPVQDPVRILGSEEDILAAYRKIRDEIGRRVMEFLSATLDGRPSAAGFQEPEKAVSALS
jgi:arsenate reductase